MWELVQNLRVHSGLYGAKISDSTRYFREFLIYPPPVWDSEMCAKMAKIPVVFFALLQVCEQESCLGPVLPLAVNLLDRFLSKCDVPKKFLQLIAADCLLIASKIRQNLPISISTLCYYTDHSVTPCQLRVSFNYSVLLLLLLLLLLFIYLTRSFRTQKPLKFLREKGMKRWHTPFANVRHKAWKSIFLLEFSRKFLVSFRGT